mmetsp:Transcript_12629/g.30156  ORF Transcript_12629/g.30156 Transcript_12629/m.30156 type:complete len:617 (-) Transcript_12629:880-2730(-)
MGFTTSYSIGGECTIDSADILRLILGYLTSQGLHQSASALRQESGVGLKGLVNQQAIGAQCLQGDWGSILKSVSLSEETPAQLHEQVILELAEAAPENMNTAFSVLKLQRESLDAVLEDEEDDEGASSKSSKLTKARSLEQKLAAMTGNPTKYQDINQRRKLLYGNQLTKQDRRQKLALQFEQQPQVPLNRLPILLQQAMKWQSHTGQLPWMREVYQDEGDAPTKRPKKKRKRRKHFDLVMGNAAADNGIVVGDPEDNDDEDLEPIPQEVSQKVKFGKGVTCESAIFCSKGLITSSSDGLIEIWNSQCTDLNMADFPYQKQSVMGHESAVLCLKLSNDGELLASGDDQGKLMVWKLSSGKCLRQFLAHNGSAISCVDWSPDSSRILTGSSDGKCRELGLRSQKILQEYVGHTSYIHSCQYVLVSDDGNDLLSLVLTGSADGCVRIWQQGNCIRILQPQRSPSAKSLMVDATQLQADQPAIHTVLTVPNRDQQGGGQNLMLVAPRSSIAYLVTLEGRVVQTYQAASDDDVFLAACISNSFVYLATQKGECLVFHLAKGTIEKTIHEFALQSTSKSAEGVDSTSAVEVTQLLHHPFRSMLGAFSNDKTQKKGILSVWK